MTWPADDETDRRADQPKAVLLAVEQLLWALPDQPRRMRVRTADFVIDLDWSGPAEAPTPRATVEPVDHEERIGQGEGTGLGERIGPAEPTVPGERTGPADTTTSVEPSSPTRHHVLAPSIGTFYRAPEPGSTPFVVEGQRVEAGRQVAIVEIMKLLLPVESDVAGTVVQLLKADGEPVEHGEPVLVIAPDETA
ncbi:acetyl-CoA carboxylase biotin carboxyl carrier protein [Saccharothrix ecbatanensis]|uniref:Biotin carboxyl carrier protein of acetyl-CoA carboxylase n=1 Tax=Saccharothrix ecbatanensis TaxID=1105145 RepID=A0A7W9LZS8_9PSEU|nr:biotin/lipoyl-containing protein [Saccharothrix ecbatanensis]MBB5802225.1 acetyl-CoA carboxylase biotin carboxyl carrier protein [Saccharothrix ecbatanensis]